MHRPTARNRGGIPDHHPEERVCGQPSLRCFAVASVIRDAGARVLWPGRGCGSLTAIEPILGAAHVRPRRPGGPDFALARRRYGAPDASFVRRTTPWRLGCVGWSLAP